MDTKTIVSVLTGAVVGVSGTLGTEELLKEPVVEEQAIVEEVPAVQPIIWVDDECGEDSLKLQLGTSFICTDSTVYNDLKDVVVDDLKLEKFTLQLEDGTPCEEESEECKKVPYALELQNRDLFGAFLVKEMLKDGEVKNLPSDPVEAKAEALKVLEDVPLEIIK